jgi:hypothetical protein
MLQADLRNRTQGNTVCKGGGGEATEGVSISLKNNIEFSVIHINKYTNIKIHTLIYNPLYSDMFRSS